MVQPAPQTSQQAVIEAEHFQHLLDLLRQEGYRLLGPTVRDGAIVYDEIHTTGELPVGWTDCQEGGKYRLKRRKDKALFGYTSGPHTWKQSLSPARELLWRAERNSATFRILSSQQPPPKQAFIGVRACELQALVRNDQVFLQGPHIEPTYASRRANAFILAVNCGQGGGTCFCASLGTGPEVQDGYDLALTEVLEGHRHYFLAIAGTDAGCALLEAAPHREAGDAERAAAAAVVQRAAGQMGRSLDPTDLPQILLRNHENPRWDAAANRCLSCGNCTMVCPTCFCSTIEDTTDLAGREAERWRKRDSCFVLDFSFMFGGHVRYSAAARFRQWVTHKLATWVEQFGTLGCVGCGRCITWCPVGIDITEEVSAIRDSDHGRKESTNGNA